MLSKDAAYLPTVPGLPDCAFQHDGQLTKREIRSITIAALTPKPNERLWDVGAGCGSVAIEWLRCTPNSKAIAFEHDDKRATIVRNNSLNLNVPHLEIVTESVPDSLQLYPLPDAIFIGGACSNRQVLETCWMTLRSGGRLVANAVTIEGQAVLSEWHKKLGGELINIALSYVKTIGRFRGLQPALAVMQLRLIKP